MLTIAAVDNVIETSCKIYDGKKREVSYKVIRALVVGYTIYINFYLLNRLKYYLNKQYIYN